MEDDLICNLSIILLDPNVAPNGPKQGMAPNGLKQTCPKTIHLAHTLNPYSNNTLYSLQHVLYFTVYFFNPARSLYSKFILYMNYHRHLYSSPRVGPSPSPASHDFDRARLTKPVRWRTPSRACGRNRIAVRWVCQCPKPHPLSRYISANTSH
jgi:hypothetical protein